MINITFIFHGCQDTCRLSHRIKIVIENETYKAISKAVALIKSWNIEFDPKYCITDYCCEEIKALESNFVSALSDMFFIFSVDTNINIFIKLFLYTLYDWKLLQNKKPIFFCLFG